MSSKTKPAAAANEKASILDAVTSRTKVIALIVLIVEALFLTSATQLPEAQRMGAFYACALLLAAALGGCFWIEHAEVGVSGETYQPVGARATALNAEWTGTFIQPLGPDGVPLNGSTKFFFEPKTAVVEGTWELDCVRADGTPLHIRYRLHGGFLDNRFLRLQYETSDGAALQFGSVVAEFHPDGKMITGSYLGYGAYSRRIVTGSLEIQRKRE